MKQIRFPNFKNISNYIKQNCIFLTTLILLFAFISCGDSSQQTTEEILSPTQGIITKVKEVEEELFKITDEEIVNKKEDSRIIASYLDGKIDTFTLEEAKLVDADNPRRRGVNGVLLGGMMGYMMGRNMNQPLSRSAYANDGAYNKSNTANSKLRSTATRRTVSKAKTGFGSSKSTKSSGG